VRRATPRSVRRVMHPVRTTKNAVTPRPIKQASRALYTVTNPIGAAENALIGAALYSGRSGRRGSNSRGSTTVRYVSNGPTATERRYAEGAAAHNALERLMGVGREKFVPLARPVVAAPRRLDAESISRAEWKKRRREVSVWDRSGRAALKTSIRESVSMYVAAHARWDDRAAARQQAVADSWWQHLLSGEPQVLSSVLVAAFADNPAPVKVVEARGSNAVLLLYLPPPSVLPERKANITPSGQLSTKAWTKTELNQVYAQLLAMHLLATLREAWAVAPSLQSIRVIGLGGPAAANGMIFDVTCNRGDPHTEMARGARHWPAPKGQDRRGHIVATLRQRLPTRGMADPPEPARDSRAVDSAHLGPSGPRTQLLPPGATTARRHRSPTSSGTWRRSTASYGVIPSSLAR
jgi:hypothetical protein